jgi:Ca-activated chloride channel family protein
MRCPKTLCLALAITLPCLAVPTAAQEQAIEVIVAKPSFLKPVFGEVEFLAEIYSGEVIERVEFFVDGERMGEDREPPYQIRVNVGQENLEHAFRAVAYSASGATGVGELTTPKLKVDEEIELPLQQLYVTVTEGGQRVLNLDRPAFQVTDNGDRQSLVTFEKGDVPLTAVLLIDVSESMRGQRLRAAVRGASAFIEEMRPLDQAMVLLFSDRVIRATAFSEDKATLLAALEDIDADGGTALNDHLYMAFNYLDSVQGRRVVVVLSDGIDLLSALRMDEVLWRARRSQALLYWIHLSGGTLETPQVASSWRNADSNAQEFELLGKTVEESGGRLEMLASLDDLEPTYRGILQELREQYVLGYYPTALRNDGTWRPVKVRVDRGGMRVRAREGYLDY